MVSISIINVDDLIKTLKYSDDLITRFWKLCYTDVINEMKYMAAKIRLKKTFNVLEHPTLSGIRVIQDYLNLYIDVYDRKTPIWYLPYQNPKYDFRLNGIPDNISELMQNAYDHYADYFIYPMRYDNLALEINYFGRLIEVQDDHSYLPDTWTRFQKLCYVHENEIMRTLSIRNLCDVVLYAIFNFDRKVSLYQNDTSFKNHTDYYIRKYHQYID